jgi:hypothetical protein
VEIARPAPGTSELEVSLPDQLPARNLLVLDVNVAPSSAGLGWLAPAWGAIALVIAAREITACTRIEPGS